VRHRKNARTCASRRSNQQTRKEREGRSARPTKDRSSQTDLRLYSKSPQGTWARSRGADELPPDDLQHAKKNAARNGWEAWLWKYSKRRCLYSVDEARQSPRASSNYSFRIWRRRLTTLSRMQEFKSRSGRESLRYHPEWRPITIWNG